jgi:hypothetical protein
MNTNIENLNFDFDYTPISFEEEATYDLFEEPTFPITFSEKPASPNFEFFIKPAKTREERFIGDVFPSSLLSNPYKYDMKIKGNELTKNVEMTLVDAETFNEITLDDKSGVTIETVEQYSTREIVVRFTINFCSFHFKKKSFRLIVRMNGIPIYTSTPFMCYARRKSEGKKPKQVQTKKQTVTMNPKNSTSTSKGVTKQNHTQPTTGMFTNLNNDQISAFALQLLQQLSPVERERVSILSGLF